MSSIFRVRVRSNDRLHNVQRDIWIYEERKRALSSTLETRFQSTKLTGCCQEHKRMLRIINSV